MENIVKEMQKFGFTKMESKTYIEVLRNPGSNGYKIANILKVPRSTVYSNLNNLYDRGAVYLISGGSNSYKAKSPEVLFSEISRAYSDSAKNIAEELEKVKEDTSLSEYINLSGYDNNISKIKEIINNTEEEIFINCGMEMNIFSEELEKAKGRGVRIILFTFLKELKIDTSNYEVFYNDKFETPPDYKENIKIVSDIRRALIASGTHDNFLGTYSENDYFIATMSTYFHLDIYLHKLEKKYETELITDEIKIKSLHENSFNRGMKK